MAIPRNLSILAQGANSSGVLGVANGGTGLNTAGTNGQVLSSNGSTLLWATVSATPFSNNTALAQVQAVSLYF